VALPLPAGIIRDNLLVKEVQEGIDNGTNGLIAYYYNGIYPVVEKATVFLLKRLVIQSCLP
jgi:hypothetical protein